MHSVFVRDLDYQGGQLTRYVLHRYCTVLCCIRCRRVLRVISSAAGCMEQAKRGIDVCVQQLMNYSVGFREAVVNEEGYRVLVFGRYGRSNVPMDGSTG